MEEGNSIFSPDDIRNENLPSWKDFNISKSEFDYVESSILIDKINYLKRGNPDDICIYYLTYFEEKDNWFKLGVTIDLDKRSYSGYHGYNYKSSEILFTANRTIIAEIEYKVKLKFKNKIIFGTETFELNDKDEILEYVKELI